MFQESKNPTSQLTSFHLPTKSLPVKPKRVSLMPRSHPCPGISSYLWAIQSGVLPSRPPGILFLPHSLPSTGDYTCDPECCLPGTHGSRSENQVKQSVHQIFLEAKAPWKLFSSELVSPAHLYPDQMPPKKKESCERKNQIKETQKKPALADFCSPGPPVATAEPGNYGTYHLSNNKSLKLIPTTNREKRTENTLTHRVRSVPVPCPGSWPKAGELLIACQWITGSLSSILGFWCLPS